jgi:hypothetical protein
VTDEEPTEEQKARARERARIPRPLRQLRAFVNRLAARPERSAADEYLLQCLREVALEKEVNSAASGGSIHPGLRVEGNA